MTDLERRRANERRWWAKHAARRRAEGRCGVSNCDQPAHPGRASCLKHLELDRARVKAWKARRLQTKPATLEDEEP